MKTNIDKAINFLQLYKLDRNKEYLVEANNLIIQEGNARKRGNPKVPIKKTKDTAISKVSSVTKNN